MVKTLNV